MKRRDLLLGSAAAVGAPAGIAEAATKAVKAVKHDAAAMEKALQRIDQRMTYFNEVELVPRPPETPAEEELFAARARLGRSALRSLYFTGAFMELEEHERLHPGVQERMRRMQPEMDEAVDGMAGLIESLSPADYRALQQELKKDPDAGLHIGERLNAVAAEDGFGFARRVDLRLAVDDMTRRLRVQNPALVLEPMWRKTRRVQAARLKEEERELEIRVKAGEQAFWELHERSKRHVAAWDTVYAARPRVDLVALEETYPEPEEHPEDPLAPGRTVMRVGGYLLGIGLGTAALGGIFYLAAAASAGGSGFAVPAVILGITIGPALIVGGLIVLLIGSIMYSTKKQPDDEASEQ